MRDYFSRQRRGQRAGRIASAWLVVAFSLVALPALAATPPEVCGSGLDETSAGTYGSCAAGYTNTIISTGTMSGCDLLCPTPDQDGDGYEADVDCDDTNRMIFPGKTYKSGSNYYTCESDGTSTDNGTSLPTGSHTYYINCDTGSGTTCSSGSPCGNLGMIAGGSPGSPPAGAKTLVAGDRVWWQGTCTTTYSDGTSTVHANLTVDGSSGSPIIIEAVPGATAKITLNGSGKYGFWVGGDYTYIYGGEYTSNTSPVNPPIRLAASTGVRVEGGYFHDLIGNGDNNFAAIYAADQDSAVIDRNVIVDVSLSTGSTEGQYGIIQFHNGNTGTYAASEYSYNVFSSTRTTNSTCGGTTDKCFTGIRFKHGTNASEMTGTRNIFGNKFIWFQKGIWVYSGSDIAIKYNLFVEGYQAALELRNDSDGSNYEGQLENINFQRNTVYNGQGTFADRDTANTSDAISYYDNVFVDDANPYNAGADNGVSGILTFSRYAADSAISSMLTTLTADRNCYYNAAATTTFCWFCGDAGGGEGGSSSDGSLNFATWQSNTSEDANSFLEDPNGATSGTLDAYHRATSTNCDDMGWALLSEEEGATPTPTPTLSPTPTPEATPYIKAFNFRGSSDCSSGSGAGFPGDAAYETYVLNGDSYPTVRGGATFGYVTDCGGDMARDRDQTVDRRLCGVHFCDNTGATAKFRYDVVNTATADKEITIANGDTNSPQGNQWFRVSANATVLQTCNDTGGTSADNYNDATCNNRAEADIFSSQAELSGTFSTNCPDDGDGVKPCFYFEFGRNDAGGSGSSTIAHIGIQDAVTPTPTASPTLSPTPTLSPSPSPTQSPTPTLSPTPTESPTFSPTPTATPTRAPTPNGGGSGTVGGRVRALKPSLGHRRFFTLVGIH